mgnify:CR=1 FL=1
MTDFATRHAAFRVQVQSALDAFLARHAPGLADISDALVPTVTALTAFLAGGKRLRPACAYWGYLGAGGTDDAIIAASASLELLQASALIHDDVMDNSDSRRGQPSIHRQFEALHRAQRLHGDAMQFGAAAAILIGDLALAWTDTMYYESGFDADALARGKRVLDAMRTELMAGQFLDVTEQARGGGSVERARRVMRYKTTAYTIERPLHLGAALAGADDATFAAYSAFGVPLGEAFQLRDDLLGVFGDADETGKPAGDDLREGKRTVLIAIAHERANAAERATLDALIGNPSLTSDQINTVREILEGTGARADVESRIDANRQQAIAALRTDAITADAADMLHALAIAATDRTA